MNIPVVTTFAAPLPLIMPISALEMTATFAGPPGLSPAMELEKSLKNCPIPVWLISEPKKINKKIYVVATPNATPNTPSCPR